jgi:hypothetical protein
MPSPQFCSIKAVSSLQLLLLGVLLQQQFTQQPVHNSPQPMDTMALHKSHPRIAWQRRDRKNNLHSTQLHLHNSGTNTAASLFSLSADDSQPLQLLRVRWRLQPQQQLLQLLRPVMLPQQQQQLPAPGVLVQQQHGEPCGLSAVLAASS